MTNLEMTLNTLQNAYKLGLVTLKVCQPETMVTILGELKGN